MSTSAVCRVCLVGKRKMHSIENQGVQEIYEILASTKLSTEDGMPKTVCYICYSQLQRCYRFSAMAYQSEQKLKSILNSDNQKVTRNSLHPLALNMVQVNNLSVTVAPAFEEGNLNKKSLVTSAGNINENNYFCFYEETPTEIKVEIQVKEEPSSEDEGSVKTEDYAMMEVNSIENKCLVKTEKLQVETNNSDDDCLVKTRRCTPINYDLPNKAQSRSKDVVHSSKHHSPIPSSTHMTIKPYSCTKCKKSFSKSRLKCLRKHLAICSGQPTMACTDCIETFTDIDDFEAHVKAHSEDKRYICPYCSKIFKTSGQMNYHIMNHTRNKPYACKVCGKAFNLRQRLTTHMTSHNKGIRPYECDLCGKTFSLKGNLTHHMRSHTGERPYLCNVCGMKFGFVSSLKQHIRRLHVEVKAYACDRCHMSFNQESGLTGHMRSHNEERPYSCDICSKTFITARKLKAHIVVHTGERPYSCNRCGNAFKRPEHLKTHQNTSKCKNFETLLTPYIEEFQAS